MLNAEKRSNLSSKAAPGRAKFNSIDNESLKESGGGGGVARGVSGGASGESRKSGISPSKKLKKSSSSSGGGGGASSKHHNHHYSRTGGSSSSSSQGQKMSLDSGSTGIATTAAAAVSGYEKGVNVGYNLFAKLRELYVELRAETSPRKQSVSRTWAKKLNGGFQMSLPSADEPPEHVLSAGQAGEPGELEHAGAEPVPGQQGLLVGFPGDDDRRQQQQQCGQFQWSRGCR